MKKYIIDNKDLLLKYLYIMISNVLIYIFSNFYFNFSEYKYIYMFLIIVIVNLIIYYYKITISFKYYLDFIVNFIIGVILLLIVKNIEDLSLIVLLIFFGNNIIFMRSRYLDKIFIRSFQYLLIPLITIINTFIIIGIHYILL